MTRRSEAAFLYGQVAGEEAASLEERAQYRLLQVVAQTGPECVDRGSQALGQSSLPVENRPSQR